MQILIGTANSGYNGTFNVVGIPSAREFTVTNATSLGTMTSDINSRTSLPTFTQKKYGTFQVYRSEEIQEYVLEVRMVYILSITNASNKPSASPFLQKIFSTY